jgi:hypothetical protein
MILQKIGRTTTSKYFQLRNLTAAQSNSPRSSPDAPPLTQLSEEELAFKQSGSLFYYYKNAKETNSLFYQSNFFPMMLFDPW